MNKMKRILFNKGSCASYTLLTAFFTIVPEDCFQFLKLNQQWSDTVNILINKCAICVLVFLACNIFYSIYHKRRKKVRITDASTYSIQIEYGDLTKINQGKVVINFDECYTLKVGEAPADIKPNSVCGQYLTQKPISDNEMQNLINDSGVKPENSKSKYNSQVRYKPGTLIPRNNDLLMAFTKLDKNGLGTLTYDEYIECLNYLWKQIDLRHGTSDVFIPILGSKITRFNRELSQQQLLDIIIASYRLSPNKMKIPYTLHIVCQSREGFSINDAFGVD
ncbi:macro domain-containing protein [Ruminococcus flavefaciens]|uniref:macro domain-containing protein n=1 Tax=Ruminococcus flavefaciens TaxID=1265 RepID=UPI0026F2416C|nr:macro domain-containing protein [Ruminococcus flavefaciens]MDD7517100.1 DUF6430 domain-containing protein [Ruminococcus flavefaciens]MDY5692095.1 DUF6430 domain-containing protein [Ruminococcus flavefaciens]